MRALMSFWRASPWWPNHSPWWPHWGLAFQCTNLGDTYSQPVAVCIPVSNVRECLCPRLPHPTVCCYTSEFFPIWQGKKWYLSVVFTGISLVMARNIFSYVKQPFVHLFVNSVHVICQLFCFLTETLLCSLHFLQTSQRPEKENLSLCANRSFQMLVVGFVPA